MEHPPHLGQVENFWSQGMPFQTMQRLFYFCSIAPEAAADIGGLQSYASVEAHLIRQQTAQGAAE